MFRHVKTSETSSGDMLHGSNCQAHASDKPALGFLHDAAKGLE